MTLSVGGNCGKTKHVNKVAGAEPPTHKYIKGRHDPNQVMCPVDNEHFDPSSTPV